MRQADPFVAVEENDEAAGEDVVEVGDEFDQAAGIGAGAAGEANHVEEALAALAQLFDGVGVLQLLVEIEGGAGLQAQQVGVGDDADELAGFVEDDEAMDIVLGHLEDGVEDLVAGTHRNEANGHDLPHRHGGEVVRGGGNEIATVAHRDDADRLSVLDDDQSRNVVLTHETGHGDDIEFRGAGHHRAATEGLDADEEEALFLEAAVGHGGSCFRCKFNSSTFLPFFASEATVL